MSFPLIPPPTAETSSYSEMHDVPCWDYEVMSRRWELIHDLLGGTIRMREVAKRWLPVEHGEKSETYDIRLSRSILYNGYGDGMEKLSAKPFSKPVTIEGTPDPQIAELLDNTDMEGTDISDFCKDVFKSAVNYGKCHVLVDYPFVERAGSLTLEKEKQLKLRPFCVIVPATMLIDWDSEVMTNGERVLTMIKMRTVDFSLSDSGVMQNITTIRIMTQTTYEVWERRYPKDASSDVIKDSRFVRTQFGEHTFGSIPLQTVYFKKTGFMTAEPPLEDLAWVNLAHWQSYSDQRNILRFCRAAILFGTGFSQEEVDRGLVMGGSEATMSTNDKASLSFVEHSGGAIESGLKDIADLENKMNLLGIQPMIRQGSVTATAKMIDESKAQSEIQSWIRSTENCMNGCFALARKWISPKKSGPIENNIKVNIFNDFELSVASAASDVQVLISLWSAGLIPDEEMLTEVKRRGLLSESFDIQKAAETARTEAKNALTNQNQDQPPGQIGERVST